MRPQPLGGAAPPVAGHESVAGGPAGASRATDPIAAPHAALTLLLLVVGVVPWRAKTYFDGQGDPVVYAKAAVIALALLLALAPRARPGRYAVAATPLVLAALYLTVTCLGAFTSSAGVVATIVVAARLALVLLAMTMLVGRYGTQFVAVWFYRVLLAVVLVSAATGVASLGGGRLFGGVPPIHPNELAMFSALCFLWIWARFIRGDERARHYPIAAALLAIVVLTGSRTALIAVSVAIVLMLTRLTRLSYSALGVGLASIPVLAYVLLSTDAAQSLMARGGMEEVGTLSNRTIAWSAAINGMDTVHGALLGSGLATKKIPVPGQWWNTQILDSSWVSALVQAGIIGLGVVGLWFFGTMWKALRHQGPLAPVWLGWVTVLAIQCALESGLFDASAAFIAFLLMSLACWRSGEAHIAQPDRLPAEHPVALRGRQPGDAVEPSPR